MYEHDVFRHCVAIAKPHVFDNKSTNHELKLQPCVCYFSSLSIFVIRPKFTGVLSTTDRAPGARGMEWARDDRATRRRGQRGRGHGQRRTVAFRAARRQNAVQRRPVRHGARTYTRTCLLLSVPAMSSVTCFDAPYFVVDRHLIDGIADGACHTHGRAGLLHRDTLAQRVRHEGNVDHVH